MLRRHIVHVLHRDIVKLTAQFVARNGAQFLDKLMVREQRNYQFDFLRKQHPLFTYFTKLVEQYSKILMPAHLRLHQLKREIENPYLVRRVSLHVCIVHEDVLTRTIDQMCYPGH